MQVANKEVAAFAFAELAATGVVGAGQVDEFEVLFGFDEGIDEAEGAFGRDVAIDFANHQHEFAFELVGVGDVGLFGVMGADGVAHPLFVPPHFVHAVVVTSARTDAYSVEVGVEEKGSG